MSGWAVVDVETTGFDPKDCRILSIAALAVDVSGAIESSSLVSLINPGVDPGPTEVHGLTAQRLAGQPQFIDIAPALCEVVDGRTLVAHNATFDHAFLLAEARRSGIELPITDVLCTVELARELRLNTINLKLSTLAHYFGVTQARPHDAHDDAAVLVQVFRHLLRRAEALGIKLPIGRVDGGKDVNTSAA